LRRTGVAVSLIVLACWIAGCGHKTTPRPATEAIPSEVGLVNAHAYPDRIVLSWSVPTSNTDGSELKDISSFQVYRTKERIGEECEDCDHEKGDTVNIDFQKPVNAEIADGEVVYTDKMVTQGNIYSYSVQIVNLRGRESPRSQDVSVVFDVPPSPPDDLTAQFKAKAVHLEWIPPGRLGGLGSYNVYRSTTSGLDTMKSIGRTRHAENYFLDEDVIPGTTYYYAVRSVRMIRGVPLESGPSQVVSALVEPLHARPPENVYVSSTRDGIRVRWDAVEVDSGDAQYNIYRSKSRRMFLKLNSRPLERPEFIDRVVDRE
jgi:fibronectin type 3 domain-containing protein